MTMEKMALELRARQNLNTWKGDRELTPSKCNNPGKGRAGKKAWDVTGEENWKVVDTFD